MIEALLDSVMRTATPLAFAALGELVSERAGVINIGLEGAIIGGCFGALLAVSTGNVALGLVGAVVVGIALTSVFAFFVIALRTDQIITGTALTLLGLGLTGTLHRAWFGAQGAGSEVLMLAPLRIPLLADLPVVGPALFDQPLTTYALYALVPAMARWMRRTHAGLALRATGEDPVAAAAAGIGTDRVRWLALTFSGAMAGLAGATLVLQVGSFNEGMSAGRGFIAISIVVLGRWTVLGTTGAALVFGAAFAMQYAVQATGWSGVPYQVWLAAPYALTLVLLASLRGRVSAPAALGK
jgi:ABC-type uncharacterized transport system permease subunit